MSRTRGVLERIRETLARGRAESELEEEMRFHIEREIERLVTAGMDEPVAARQAHRSFGGVRRAREEAREELGVAWVEQTWRDLRYAARGFRRNPGFAAAAVLTLALGIGATTAIYSVVEGVVVAPLPYPGADRLVRVFQQNSATNRWSLSVADFQAIEEQQRAFESVAAVQPRSVALTGRGRPERVASGWVTAGWFDVLGVAPYEGRVFSASTDEPGSSPAVVIGAAFRDRIFARGEPAVGAVLVLDGISFTVVGVLGPERRSLAGIEADVWPLLELETPARRGPFFLRGFGRLKQEATIETAREDLAAISERIFPIWSSGFSDANARLTPYALQSVVVGDAGRTLWPLLGAVAAVLVIAIGNVANLLLARATGREDEVTLRASLGASRPRLARQFAAESLLLAIAGGGLGVLIAVLGIETLVRTSPLPRLDEISLDTGVLSFAGVVSLGSGFLFGLAPLLHGVSQGLDRGARGSGGGSGVAWARFRSALVAIEFALVLPLLAGSILLLQSFVALGRVDPGFDTADLVSGSVALPAAAYPDFGSVRLFWDEALSRIEELPSIEAVGVATGLPPDFAGNTNNFDLLDRPVRPGESEHVSIWTWSSPGFLAALGVPLLEGRAFDSRDDGDAPPVAVVSRSWAERFYPGGDAVGKRLYSGGDRGVAITIVGVVGDVKYAGLDAADDAVVHEPYAQAAWRSVKLLVRARGPAPGTAAAVQEEIGAVDPSIPLSDVESMNERLSAAVAGPRYRTTLLGVFAGVGLALAAIGIYGVVSYHVGRRRRDIGIRLALGAKPAAVYRSVLGHGLARAGAGIAVGLVAAGFLMRLLTSLLYGVSPLDPAALGAAALVLAVIALLACWLPARRATRIDPMRTLRTE